ncbi:transglycosylase domain-containing protein, partial [Chloroflexota bacterium]
MSESGKIYSSEDDFEHEEEGTSNSDGEGGNVPETSEAEHNHADDESSSVVSEEIKDTIVEPLSDESADSIDDEESQPGSEVDEPQNIADENQQEVEARISKSEASPDHPESTDLYSSFTASGWYNPDEEQLSAPAPNVSEPSQENETILGDTQPVILSPDPKLTSRMKTDGTAPGDHGNNDPLPGQLNVSDLGATKVTAAAYGAASLNTRSTGTFHPQSGNSQASRAAAPPSNGGSLNWERSAGCLLRVSIAGLFLMVILGIIGTSFLLFQYYRIAATLPPVDDLRQKASQFETTRILDRNGNILYEILDPTAGRRSYVSMDNISPYLVAAIVATEDKGFYSHPGFDVTAIGRAFLQNYQGGETISGASTITQQLARMLLFSPEERSEITYMRKVREAILAAEITRRYTKDEILELYINDVYFGNLAYGVEAAAQTYFRTSVDKLTLSQAAFLAG